MVVSVEQACNALGCKRSKVFELLSIGTLERAPRYGREIRIYTASVERALLPKTKKARERCRRPSGAGFSLSEIPL